MSEPKTIILFDKKVVPKDISACDFFYGLSVQMPGWLFEGDVISLKMEIIEKNDSGANPQPSTPRL